MSMGSGYRVSTTRRLLASLIDFVLVGIVSFFMMVFIYFGGWEGGANVGSYPIILSLGIGLTLFYAIWDSCWFGTFGKWLLSIRIVIDRPEKRWRYPVRFFCKWIPLFMMFYYPTVNSYYQIDPRVIEVWGLAAAASFILFLVNMCLVFATLNPFHDWVSGARLELRRIWDLRPVEPRGFEVIMDKKKN